MTPEARWFPVALAAGLDPGTSTGTRLFGRELVVWRDDSGASHVWEDRCPHRGMRLSFGFVRGDHIACLYHGWRFDGAGQCRFIPAHPQLDVPATIQTNRYTAVERLGMVWVFFGAAEAAEAQPGDPAPPGDNAPVVPVRSLSVDAPIEAVVAALERAKSPFDPVAPVQAVRDGPLLSLRAGDDRLVVALQPLSSGETCLHLAIAGAEATARGVGQARVSRWAEGLRRSLEGEAPHAEAAA